MATHKLENYLRTYRKRSGLTQREVAFLVGCRNGAQVSRYEKRRRLPPLRTALACEAAFGVPVSVLFAGLREVAGQAVGERLLALKSKLETNPSQGRDFRPERNPNRVPTVAETLHAPVEQQRRALEDHVAEAARAHIERKDSLLVC